MILQHPQPHSTDPPVSDTSLFRAVELLGALAAATTTLCWLPQLFKILREREASGISLATNAALASGVFLWCVYGVLISSWPVIAATAVTLFFIRSEEHPSELQSLMRISYAVLCLQKNYSYIL